MSFAKMGIRQKVVAILLVIVGIILIWQLYGLFTDHQTVAPAAPAVAMAPAANKQAMAVTPTTTAAQFAQAAPAVANNADMGTAVNPNNSQAEYLRLVNEYQMAQLQRMIAEDNEAIAIARQNAAKAMTETSKLLGGNAFSGVADSVSANNLNNNEYQLVYTGQQTDGGWTATLKKNGQTNDVLVGSELSDGSQVIAIDDNGVLLQKGAAKKLVTFSGVTTVNAQQSVAKMTTPPPVKKNNDTAALPLKSAHVAEKAIKPVLAALPVKAANSQHTTVKTSVSVKESVKEEIKEVKEKAEKMLSALTVASETPAAPDKKNNSNTLSVVPAAIVHDGDNQEKNHDALSDKKSKPLVSAPHLNKEATPAAETTKMTHASLPSQEKMLDSPYKAVAVPHAASADGVSTTQDILAKDPDNYTLQLTSVRNLENLRQFINENNLQDKATYFSAYDMQSRPLYILIYGEFTTASDAKAALAKLPADAKKEGAFIVKFSTIQTVLKKPALPAKT